MNRKLIIFLLTISAYACDQTAKKQSILSQKVEVCPSIDSNLNVGDYAFTSDSSKNNEINSFSDTLEKFIDSSQIGFPNKNKVKLLHIRNDSGLWVKIQVFKKVNKSWMLSQQMKVKKIGLRNLFPTIKDFNFDGKGDLTFCNGDPARGANETKELLLFNTKQNQLKLIKNGSRFPNLRVNEKLKCIDAFAVFGGTSTIFLHVSGDSLRKFAEVESFDSVRKVFKYDKTGKRSLIKEDQITPKELFIRYVDFNPIEKLSSN